MDTIGMNALMLEPFTTFEWTEMKNKRGPRNILVSKDGQEEVILSPTPVDEPNGSYILTSLGTLQEQNQGTQMRLNQRRKKGKKFMILHSQ